MAISLPQLNYGTVIGRFLVELSDSDDADLNPDVYPADGYVVFTPGTSFASVLTATPDPATIFPQKVIGVLDAEGYLHQAKFNGPTGAYARAIDGSYVPDNGVGVRLQATDDSDINPNDWTWKAEFHFNYNKTPISYSSFNFHLPSNQTVDLAVVRPVSEQSGEYTIVGPQGPRGEIGDPGPSTVLSIGKVTTKPTGSAPGVSISGESPNQVLSFELPQGPVGPSGGPIPAGGVEGDSVMRGLGTSSEWRFTDGIQDNLFPNGSLEYQNNYRWSTSMESKSTDAPPGYSTSMWCPPGASSFGALNNDPTPIIQGDSYIFEVWVKADKPNSNLYIEMRDQDGSHAGKWYWNEGGTNPTTAYPVGQYSVPTEWTRIRSVGEIIPEATHLTVATFFFNHTSGAEREASVGIAGLRVYRAPSKETLSPNVRDVIPSSDQKALLNGASDQDDSGTLVLRNSSGSSEFSSVTVTDTTPNTPSTLTSREYVDNSGRVDLISRLRTPIVVAHRGGLEVYPEESMEGFIGSAQSGYLPEMDIQFLKDGVPVLCHDTTVNRTMSGVTGSVSNLTSEQWRKGRINAKIPGGKSAKPVFFEDVLDRLGGTIVLVPEIKTSATDSQVDLIIDMVKEKRLEKSVILQSFTWETCQRIQNAGLTALFLSNSTLSYSAATIKAAGIKFVGPSKSMSTTNINSLISAGLKVIPYSPKTLAEVQALPSGISGFFSDDPWGASDEMQEAHTGWWQEGIGWPRRIVTSADSGNSGAPYDGTKYLRLRGGGIHVPKDPTMSITHIGLDHIIGGTGLIERPLSVSARFALGRRTTKDSSTIGFTLIRNTIDQDAIFKDTTNPGQNGYTIGVRRNGDAVIWRYVNGASAESILVVPNFWTPVGEDHSEQIVLTLDMSETYLKFAGTGPNGWMTIKDEIQGPFRVYLRVGGTETSIYDVAVGPYANSNIN